MEITISLLYKVAQNWNRLDFTSYKLRKPYLPSTNGHVRDANRHRGRVPPRLKQQIFKGSSLNTIPPVGSRAQDNSAAYQWPR